MSTRSFGDIVKYNGHKAKVISVWINYLGKRQTRIRFDDQGLIPNEMEVSEDRLEDEEEQSWYNQFYNKKTIDPEVYCPKCGKDWEKTEHPIYGKKVIWYDCRKCNTKREDYFK